MRPEQRKMQSLHRRVRTLEAQLAEPKVQFRGAPLTSGALADYYHAERAKGARFVRLVVHPELADEAQAVVAPVARELRGLARVVTSEDVPECGWKVERDV